jgi:TRAP-type C4-dicarboxylate transport system substrate-binding protein
LCYEVQPGAKALKISAAVFNFSFNLENRKEQLDMKWKHFLVLMISLTVIPATATAQAGDKPIIIKWAHCLATNEPTHVAALEVAKRVKERTGGRVDIQIFPNSQLGGSRDTYEQARLGAPVIAHIDPGYASEYGSKSLSVLSGPYIFDTPEEAEKIGRSALVQGWNEKLLLNGGLRILTWNWYFGERYIISDRGYKRPDDLEGVKVRVPPNPVWVETYKLLGATCVTLEWTEVYTGLSQGVVAAAEAPLSTLYGSRLYEVKKVITETGHFKAISGHVIGESFFQSLPKDVQQILVEEIRRGGIMMSKLTIEKQEEYKKLFADAGVSFVSADAEAFKKATRPFYGLNPEWPPDIYDQVQEIIRGK